jgi:histidine phosphotransfer protein HptB
MSDKANTNPVDLLRIQGLSEGDRGFEEEVIRAFVGDCSARLARLEAAIPAGDADAVRRDAHTIKGASGNIGTVTLHELARQLERVDLQESPEAAAEILDQLREEFEQVRGYLEGYLAE